MRALSDLFDVTTLVLPCGPGVNPAGESALSGHNLTVAPLTVPSGAGLGRKLRFPFWLARNCSTLLRELWRADAVHAPIPGDVGTIGLLLASLLRKPLFVRHCGNWRVQRTAAERFWRWFMERFAGGINIMLATGGASEPPSPRNPNVSWIFSTAMTESQLTSAAVLHRRELSRPCRLIIASRQERDKGTGRLIECLPHLHSQMPGATLDVIGDGSALGEFRALAAKLNLSAFVRFHGKLDHGSVIGLFQQADIFCYPTTASEGFPKVVLEALACGLPVVTNRVSVLPRLIEGRCGILLEESTPQAIAAAIGAILQDPGRYRAMSEHAIQTARRFSLERWRAEIGEKLAACWGPLRSPAPRHPVQLWPDAVKVDTSVQR
jgi:glycosyltransferase involved in cell wall biosynthesis